MARYMMTRKLIFTVLLLVALFSAVMLSNAIYYFTEINSYNKAINQSEFAKAKDYLGDYGLFSNAYAEQQKGGFQEALIGYASLEETNHENLRKNALFNAGNTYLQQAMKLDIERDAEQVLPLIELAKVSYRRVLRIDNKYWGAKYNLERALLILPDAVDADIITQKGYARLVKAVISAANEDELP